MSAAGRYRQRVVIESAVDTQDSTTGEPIRTWSELATVWAAVEPLKGRELLLDGGLRTEVDTRVLIRWAPALASLGTKARVRHSTVAGRPDVLYNVISVVEAKLMRKELELLCKSGTNEG